MRVILPDAPEQKAANEEEAMMIIQAYAQYKFSDYAYMVEKLQMDIGSKKQKIMPGLSLFYSKELKEMEKNIQERVTDLNASIEDDDDDDWDIPDFSLEVDDNTSNIGKIWLPEPYGPQKVENLHEVTYVINAFLRITMPDLIDLIDKACVIADDGTKLKILPVVNVIPLKDFVKMNNLIALRMNALAVLSKHFDEKSFDICPDCGEVQMERTLSCSRCGYTRKLNRGVDNL